MADLTAARLKEVLAYVPETGEFVWRVSPTRSVKAGAVAGGVKSNGYMQIRVDGIKHYAHRLAWLYVHGVWPDADIDHINGERADNRIANLRDVSRQGNNQNERKPRKYNQTGLMGVYLRPGAKKYRAAIIVDKKQVHLGYFESAEDAHQAYLKAKRALHPTSTV